MFFNVFLQISLNCSPYSLERVFQTAEIHSLRHHKPSIWHRSSGRRRDSNHSVWYVSSCVNWNAYFILISFFSGTAIITLGKALHHESSASLGPSVKGLPRTVLLTAWR